MDQVQFTAKIQPLNVWSDMVCLGRPYNFNIFKACLPQISLGPFLNTLTQTILQEIQIYLGMSDLI